ncbi:MAG: DUF4097 family beta strand repeat-containing protein [Myxococcota bacterium]
MKTLAVFVAALMTTGCIISIDPDGINNNDFDAFDSQFDALPGDLTDLTVIVPAGDFNISTGDDLGIDAELSWVSDSGRPQLDVTAAGGSVTHRWSCPGRDGCQVDLVVTVPEGMENITIDLEAGDFNAADLSGRLVLDLEAGDIEIDGHNGELAVETEAGNIDATDLESDDVDARSEAGNVDLELLVRPTAINATTSAGNIDVSVPAGAYALDLNSNIGNVDIDNGIDDDPNADASIRARTEAGQIRIDAN